VSAFSKFDGLEVDILLAKLAYVALNIAGIGVALWQANRMGLLPHLDATDLKAPESPAFTTLTSVSFS
jgi:hypothetical protein